MKAIHDALEPFHKVTKRLEGGAETGAHGVIWEALLMFDYLMTRLETQRAQLEQEAAAQAQNHRGVQRYQRHVNPLLIYYQNAWQKLQK